MTDTEIIKLCMWLTGHTEETIKQLIADLKSIIMSKEKQKYVLKGHNYQIADTGDYDGCWEITNGKVSIFTKDDNDEGLEDVVVALNNADCDFYLDDSKDFELHIANEELKLLKGRESLIEQARAEELKKHAVEFAEFANQKAIRMGAHKMGHYINGYKEVVTTEQLYNLFNPPKV